MLTLTPARGRRAGSGKLGIALAGGGPLGSFYELGALRALEEAIVGRKLTDFDVYVGVSSGSYVLQAWRTALIPKPWERCSSRMTRPSCLCLRGYCCSRPWGNTCVASGCCPWPLPA